MQWDIDFSGDLNDFALNHTVQSVQQHPCTNQIDQRYRFMIWLEKQGQNVILVLNSSNMNLLECLDIDIPCIHIRGECSFYK